MQSKDTCIPWDPIPREQSKFYQIKVFHLEEPPARRAIKLRIALTSAAEEDWLLVFSSVIAYRMRFYPKRIGISFLPSKERYFADTDGAGDHRPPSKRLLPFCLVGLMMKL